MRHSSSYINETTYDQDAQTLDVTFNDGAEWRYSGVPQGVYAQLVASSSVGRAFRALIRDSYEGEPL